MRAVISSGHGLHIRGARGNPVPPQCDEVDEVRRIVDRVAQIMKDGGVDVATFHDNTSYDQDTNLKTIVGFHNSKNRELDCSIHLNATPGAYGTEVWYATQADLAAKVSLAIADAGGFKNRGAKKNGLYFLNNTNKPAILIECFFCDSESDCNKYRANFEAICRAIAASIAGDALESKPPKPPIDVPTPPERPKPPIEVAGEPRPTISEGDYGSNVRELQKCLKLVEDGDFGPQTASATKDYQRANGLSADGVVGPQTWTALSGEFGLPRYPWPLPDVLEESVIEEITRLAWDHPISDYQWKDRGQAPAGLIKGLAISYAQACMRLAADDPIAKEMSKANTHNDADDALSWLASDFNKLGMSNEESGRDTLRHLHVLLLGLAMRESSGQHCCGRDMSATNTSSTTAEAGAWQMSWNCSSCCTDMLNLFDSYEAEKDSENECPQGYLSVWQEDVSCSSSDWQNYGSGDGATFQAMAKSIPVFACECTAVGLRCNRQHWGPINRKEAEIRKEADQMLRQIEDIVDTIDAD